MHNENPRFLGNGGFSGCQGTLLRAITVGAGLCARPPKNAVFSDFPQKNKCIFALRRQILLGQNLRAGTLARPYTFLRHSNLPFPLGVWNSDCRGRPPGRPDGKCCEFAEHIEITQDAADGTPGTAFPTVPNSDFFVMPWAVPYKNGWHQYGWGRYRTSGRRRGRR